MSRPRAHLAARVALLAVVWVVGVLIATSDLHGTGARDVSVASADPRPDLTAGVCPATVTNPGGRNNYRPGAPAREALGTGFVVEGVVRGRDCAPLSGVRLQIWLQTATAGETVNRAAVRTGPDGSYRLTTDPLTSQFGEPNVHVAHDGDGERPGDDAWRAIFVRHVVAPDATGARVDLVVTPADP